MTDVSLLLACSRCGRLTSRPDRLCGVCASAPGGGERPASVAEAAPVVEERRWRVVCPDGLIRHADFDDQDEAFRWADLGHFCEASTCHEVRAVVDARPADPESVAS